MQFMKKVLDGLVGLALTRQNEIAEKSMRRVVDNTFYKKWSLTLTFGMDQKPKGVFLCHVLLSGCISFCSNVEKAYF